MCTYLIHKSILNYDDSVYYDVTVEIGKGGNAKF